MILKEKIFFRKMFIVTDLVSLKEWVASCHASRHIVKHVVLWSNGVECYFWRVVFYLFLLSQITVQSHRGHLLETRNPGPI